MFGSTVTVTHDNYSVTNNNGVISNKFTSYSGVTGGKEGVLGTNNISVSGHTLGLNQAVKLGFLGFTTGPVDFSIDFNIGENTYSLGISQDGIFRDDSNTHNGVITGFRNSFSITPAATAIVGAVSTGAIYIYNNAGDLIRAAE